MLSSISGYLQNGKAHLQNANFKWTRTKNISGIIFLDIFRGLIKSLERAF
jgi:hypothetical protein